MLFIWQSLSQVTKDVVLTQSKHHSWVLLGAILFLAEVKFRTGEQTAKGRRLFL